MHTVNDFEETKAQLQPYTDCGVTAPAIIRLADARESLIQSSPRRQSKMTANVKSARRISCLYDLL